MAGKRATQFAALVKQYREEMHLSKEEVIGYFSVSSEVPGFVRTKAKRMIAKAERKAETGTARKQVRNW